uniref:EF-hand domain-containing protein n=1 Tax=Globisporangium ultimum (strain ATCC 200006 / CBS 805.95 / DAOM BR144) TaxID=431595 RepID=K3X5P9_GLOUD
MRNPTRPVLYRATAGSMAPSIRNKQLRRKPAPSLSSLVGRTTTRNQQEDQERDHHVEEDGSRSRNGGGAEKRSQRQLSAGKRLSEMDISTVPRDVIFVDFHCLKYRRHVNLSGWNASDASLQLLRNGTFETLTLDDCGHVTAHGFKSSIDGRVAASMKAISLQRCQALNTTIIETFPDALIEVNLSYCEWADDHALRTLAKHCHLLTTVAVCHCKRVTDYGIAAFPDSSTKPALTNIDISHCTKITDVGILALLTKALKLEVLVAAGLTMVEGLNMQGLVRTSNSLESLNFSSNSRMQYMTMVHLIRVYANTKLTDLNLSYCTQVTDDTLVALGRHCPNLRTLRIASCPMVSDHGVQRLVEFVPGESEDTADFMENESAASRCVQLQTLDLTGCFQLTDVALSAIGQKCSSLQVLLIDGVRRLTALGLRVITEHCVQLHTLSWSGILIRSSMTVDVDGIDIHIVLGMARVNISSRPGTMDASVIRRSSVLMTTIPSQSFNHAGALRAGYNDAQWDDVDEDDDHLMNLTLDGVKEGPYMLCKHADDLLGHRARQVFREKASSMRGENSIYYYLKQLMKKFGSTNAHAKKKAGSVNEPEQLELEAHAFRKLISSDPAFECAISSDQVDALFHRIEQDHQQVIRHQDFVEFCLLDHNQLKLLRKLRLTDNELADTFKRLARAGSTELAPELFHSAISRELDVVLTSGEIGYLMHVMDYDKDGIVKVSDFEVFVKDDKAALELVHPTRENAVVDIKISIHEADEITNRREGYSQLFPKLQDDSTAVPPMHLWLKTALREDGKAAISNIRYAASSRETDLVAKGFTCLKQDINRNGSFGKHKYIWVSHAPSNVQTVSEIIGLALTCGDLSDKNDARLWLPPHRGFKLIPGNLNEKSAKVGVFLWVRRRRLISAHDLVDLHIDQTLISPRSKSSLRLHIDDLEEHVRKTLRRNCPLDQDGALNFGRLFDEFDTKKTRGISKQVALVGIESFGIKMVKKDFALVWQRMNPFSKKQIDTLMFAQFLELNDSEIDDVVNTLQRSMTTRFGYSVPNYRLIFQSYNSLNDGKLSRSDFQRIFATNQLNFTNSELSKVMQRFDVNKDGVVDYTDFLRYVTGICDASSRIAGRIFDAAEEIRTWAIEKQNRKMAKDGNIDSTAAWKCLKLKHGLLETASLDHILRQRNARLDSEKLQSLKVLMAPATNGEVNQVTFHAFVNHFPKKIATMVYDLKKIIGPVPEENKPDVMFDRLNVEGNGKLSLVNFAKQVNALAMEKNANVTDLKDFVYVVEWTGANCGGDGAVLIDRFVATIRENQERRNMKNEFVTHYDSPQFLEGVQLLRDEIKKCAKTLDGKFNFLIPFRQFDKDNSGQIMLSEFEAAIRELGVDKYLSDQEIKSLMRRFDPNSSGAIDYDEFLRFNLAESTSTSSRKLCISPVMDPAVHHILEDIIIHERLSSTNAVAFCSSLKRMFGIIDKETTGFVPNERFVLTLREMGITVPQSEMGILVHAFAGEDDNSVSEVHYLHFCDLLLEICAQEDDGSLSRSGGPPATELLDILMKLYNEFQEVKRKAQQAGYADFDFYRAFGIDKDTKESLFISAEEFKEVLWVAGVRHPYLREELEAIISCFQVHQRSGFNVAMFCKFLQKGPSALFVGNSGSLDVFITRLQDQLKTYLSTGKDAEDRLLRLFAECDEDASGAISHEEFIKLLQIAGFRHYLSLEDEKLLLKFLDANGDGFIVYSEFLDFAKHADEKLNTVVANDQPSLESPAPSPTKSVPSPVRPVGSPSPSRESSKGKPTNPNKPESAPYAMLVARIWKLNQKLRPEFPFEKYFNKYRIQDNKTFVKKRVFDKIIDKFLTKLTDTRVTYNMHEMDVDLLTHAYGPRDDTIVNYSLFLKDMATAQARTLSEKQNKGTFEDYSSDSSSDEDELSCSSDDDDESRSKKKQMQLSVLLGDAVKRVRKSKSDLDLLQSDLKALMADWGKRKKRDHVSEHKVYKVLTKLAIRLRKKEADLLLSSIAVESNGRTVYDSAKLFKLIGDAVHVASGGNASTKQASDNAAGGSAKPEPADVNGPPPPPSLSPALAERIYRCFLNAAQKNISGRKLLEKCDVNKTGAVTLLEFQTVLRLMGCTLRENEVDEIKKVLGNDKNSQISYIALVQQISKLQQQMQKAASTVIDPGNSYHPSPTSNKAPRKPTPPPLSHTPSHAPAAVKSPPSRPEPATRAMMAREDMMRADSFLRPFFVDLLHTRSITCETVLQHFEAYDGKGSGFVSTDAFHAVMRKLDIWLPEEVSSTVSTRFTSFSGDKFDYIDFCQVVTPQTLDAEIASQAGHRAFVSTPSSLASAAPKLPQPSMQLATQDPPKVPDGRESVAVPIFHRKQFASDHSAKFERSSVSLPSLDNDSNSKPEQQRTRPTPVCEICATQNPASVEYELLLQCSTCGFRNKPSTSMCDLCSVPLHATRSPGPEQKSSGQSNVSSSARAPSNAIPQLQFPPKVSYDEGWIT